MTKNVDIYSDEALGADHSLRYLHIVARNVVGILNRIASLMRRRRYNMEEVSVSFDSGGRAHIIVAIDGQLHDVNHVIQQLRKLYDIYEVYDATHEHGRLYHTVFVQVQEESRFEGFPMAPDKIVQMDDGFHGIFAIPLEEMAPLLRFLEAEKIPYWRRIVGIL